MPLSGILWKDNAQKWVETSEKELQHIQLPSRRPATLCFISKGLWNPVDSADLHLFYFLCPVMCCLCLFVFLF